MTFAPLLLAGLLSPVAYNFGPQTKLDYDVNVHFDGFLPLMGGNEGKVEVKMGVGVDGKEPSEGNQRASSEIRAFEISFNGQKLPLGLDNVVDYFPKTNISFTPQGKIVATDAPDKKLPVRLPGLDVKHFPDITYVPVELPGDGLEVGREWTFQRDFGGAPISYSCKAESFDNGTWKLHITLEQSFTTLENSSIEVVTNKADAVSEVTTTMTGDGTVNFDTQNGRVLSADMTNTSKSDVKSIADGTTKTRQLVTKYSIKVKNGKSPSSKQVANTSASLWDQAVSWTNKAVQTGRGALVWIQTASLFGLKALPTELDTWVKPLKPYLRRWAPWLGT